MLQTIQNTGISTVFLRQVLPKLFSQRLGCTASPTAIWDEVIMPAKENSERCYGFPSTDLYQQFPWDTALLCRHCTDTGKRKAQQLHRPQTQVGEHKENTWQILQECGCARGGIWGGQALVLPQGTRTPGPGLLAVTNSTCSNNTSPGHTAEVNSSQPEPELRMEGRAKHGLSPSPASGSSPHGSVHVNRPCAGVLDPSSCGVLAACPAACTGLMSVVSPRTERCYHGPLSERSPAWKIGWCEIRMHLG